MNPLNFITSMQQCEILSNLVVQQCWGNENCDYYKMEKGQNRPESQMAQKHNNFPVLRKSSSLAKPIISLAKVELDCHLATMEHTNSNSQSRQITTSFSHKRIGSGISIRQLAQSNFAKTSRNQFNEPKIEGPKRLGSITQQSSTNISASHKEFTKEIQKAPQVHNLEKAKISTKSVGHIKAYSVNSHPGPLSSSNEDRVCIVTNLNRSACKDNQISFFSIYDGKDGVAKAEYFRDNFHNVLSKDGDLFKDIQKAIRKTFCIVDQGFRQNLQGKNCSTDVAVNICLIIDDSVYFIQTDDSKVVVSTNLARQAGNPLSNPEKPIQQKNSGMTNRYKYFIKTSQRFQKRQEVQVRKIGISGLDFIVLGSEGLFENFSERQIGRKIWQTTIKSNSENLHLVLGEATNVVMHEVFKNVSTKNVSIILIAFSNMLECLKGGEELLLPFGPQSNEAQI